MTAQAGSIISDSKDERRALRQRMRAARRALPPGERVAADRAICAHILRLPVFRRARRVALYLAFDGEPTLKPVFDAALRHGKTLYAPVIAQTRMHFSPLTSPHGLATNFFGILEPAQDEAIDPRRLDLVLTPLVAFDDRGVRVGVGRGYYDRRFSFLRGRERWHRPKLLGVAYELQRVASLEHQPWDVPLWGAVTEAGVRRFQRN